MPLIRKILIANRGEIAVRIQRAAREMGIGTVAVFSDPDRTAPHVLACDEAYPLHGIASAETYLRIDKLLEIAERSNADAIHPGYGFLSEKEQFAKAVTAAGLTFIGPGHAAIGLLGSKTAARELLASKNVPIVPGTVSPIKDLTEALKVASRIGYPVLIKASGGGGGKGMRRVDTPEELPAAIERARNEALKSFADDRVYLEKFIVDPKHIEIQVLADSLGNVIHLGERECSVQRRHQKVVEECPSTVVSAALRDAMGRTAVEIVKAAGYVNAGTVEFLLDAQKHFYFLEVNTRVQVEHPITEMVFGIDIVKEQIRIAQGEPLSLTQDEVRINGHAIESRIYAEEYDNSFLPSTGTILHYHPSEGPGVRNDSGVRSGSEITMHYDPMIAKLITHGRTREEAIARMIRALQEYRIDGVKTTIPFCEFVLSHPAFMDGSYDINFVERHFTGLTEGLDNIAAASIAAAESNTTMGSGTSVNANGASQRGSRWKQRGRDE